ncbi:defense protein 3-like [Melitaea cinxia]|uniref:defense protein 3-like n=1 Tax=Melitaea cinxia TaxID=113334 RepID=UPI001E274639|nr:defense protein 3-like [Melitaea cinxia]
MPLTGGVNENLDGTKDFNINAMKEFDNHTVHASAYVVGQRDKPDPMNLNSPPYKVVGGSLAVEKAGHSVGLHGQHIPEFGNRVTGTANVNVLKTNDHKVDVNAFTTQTITKAGPNFSTHGGGVDYTFKEKFGANTSVAHTHMFNKTDYSVGSHVNLYKNPTTSVDFKAGVQRTDIQFGRGNWEKQGFLHITKKF